jgi:hypothetical protein
VISDERGDPASLEVGVDPDDFDNTHPLVEGLEGHSHETDGPSLYDGAARPETACKLRQTRSGSISEMSVLGFADLRGTATVTPSLSSSIAETTQSSAARVTVAPISGTSAGVHHSLRPSE